MRQPAVVLIFGLSVLGGCASQSPGPAQTTAPAAGPSIADVLQSYGRLTLMTPRPAAVGPFPSGLCFSSSYDESAASHNGPHKTSAINVFMSESAAQAFRARTAYPAGAVIVKEKHLLEFEANGVIVKGAKPEIYGIGGMIKRQAGYDRRHGDWEFFYTEQGGKIDSGTLENCRNCHDAAAHTDHVYGDWAKARS